MLGTIVSPYVGLVRSVDERLVGTADARLPTYTAELAADDRLLGTPLSHVGALCGMGLDHASAADAALGEAAERYSLCWLPDDRLVDATAVELGDAAVPPERFALFSDAQYARPRFPFARFESTTRIRWIDGWDVATGASVWLPAELVYLVDAAADGSVRIGYATSSGAACAPTTDEAVLRGLLELCERDAFAIVWAARLSLPLIDWWRHEELAALEERYFAPSGLGYAVVDLSCFHGLPSLLAVVRAPASETAAVGVGAGTAAAPERAWWKALGEAFGTRAAARAFVTAGRTLAEDGGDVRSFDDHIAFHAPAARSSISAFLDGSRERVDVGALPRLTGSTSELVAEVAARIRAAGSTAYAVDVTAPDIAGLGLRVVKTVAPELCMLDVPHAARFLGARRLHETPHELGLAPRRLAAGDLNPYPHPFP